jgi:hypothetical protein
VAHPSKVTRIDRNEETLEKINRKISDIQHNLNLLSQYQAQKNIRER